MFKCASCPCMVSEDPERPWVKQCYDCFRDDRTKRRCTICLKHKIIPQEENDWQKICGSCYSSSPLKPCIGCKLPKIKSVEDWRQLCSECWLTKEKWLKICESCCKRPLPKGAAAWVKDCSTCWLEKKKRGWEECPSCDSKKLIKRKGAPACRDCMIKAGKIKLVDQNGSLIEA